MCILYCYILSVMNQCAYKCMYFWSAVHWLPIIIVMATYIIQSSYSCFVRILILLWTIDLTTASPGCFSAPRRVYETSKFLLKSLRYCNHSFMFFVCMQLFRQEDETEKPCSETRLNSWHAVLQVFSPSLECGVCQQMGGVWTLLGRYQTSEIYYWHYIINW